MNILAVDCAVSRLCVGLRYDDKMISQTLDIGMRQSEMLLPVIDELFKRAGISPADLDATAMTIGPGSFTGLRLGISALKAIQLAHNVPVYAVSSLECYAHPFSDCGLPVLSGIDANKGKFYASITESGKIILGEDDHDTQKIAEAVRPLEKVIVAGPDASALRDALAALCPDTALITMSAHFDTAETLAEICERMIGQKKEPLKDFDGPSYLRASEAELKRSGIIA